MTSEHFSRSSDSVQTLFLIGADCYSQYVDTTLYLITTKVCFHDCWLVLRRTVLWKSILEWPLICSLCRFCLVFLCLLWCRRCFQGCFIPHGPLPPNLCLWANCSNLFSSWLPSHKEAASLSTKQFYLLKHRLPIFLAPTFLPPLLPSPPCIKHLQRAYLLLGKGHTLQITRQIPTPVVFKPQ